MRLAPTSARTFHVLVIDECLPFPPDVGRFVRTWNLLRRLAARHTISLLCYGDPESAAARAVRAAGISLHFVRPFPAARGARLYGGLFANVFSRYPYSVWKHYTRRYENRLGEVLRDNQFDLVHCECTVYARFLRVVDKLPTLVMAHNIESQILSRRAHQSQTILDRVFFGLQARKMESFERDVLRQANQVATVTQLDADQARAWGVERVSLVENGVDLDYFTPPEEPAGQCELLFFGALDWYPNLDSVEYLLEEIWPLILRRLPAAKLRIVGRRPPPRLGKRVTACPGVELVGEVPDVRPYLAWGTVVLVPLRIGGGSRIKILEALAMGKAVVSTSVGAEGLAVEDGMHIRLADTPAAFVQATVELLTSPGERRRLGENGRWLVVERYSWDRAGQALESAWLQVCEVGESPESRRRR